MTILSKKNMSDPDVLVAMMEKVWHQITDRMAELDKKRSAKNYPLAAPDFSQRMSDLQSLWNKMKLGIEKVLKDKVNGKVNKDNKADHMKSLREIWLTMWYKISDLQALETQSIATEYLPDSVNAIPEIDKKQLMTQHLNLKHSFLMEEPPTLSFRPFEMVTENKIPNNAKPLYIPDDWLYTREAQEQIVVQGSRPKYTHHAKDDIYDEYSESPSPFPFEKDHSHPARDKYHKPAEQRSYEKPGAFHLAPRKYPQFSPPKENHQFIPKMGPESRDRKGLTNSRFEKKLRYPRPNYQQGSSPKDIGLRKWQMDHHDEYRREGQPEKYIHSHPRKFNGHTNEVQQINPRRGDIYPDRKYTSSDEYKGDNNDGPLRHPPLETIDEVNADILVPSGFGSKMPLKSLWMEMEGVLGNMMEDGKLKVANMRAKGYQKNKREPHASDRARSTYNSPSSHASYRPPQASPYSHQPVHQSERIFYKSPEGKKAEGSNSEYERGHIDVVEPQREYEGHSRGPYLTSRQNDRMKSQHQFNSGPKENIEEKNYSRGRKTKERGTYRSPETSIESHDDRYRTSYGKYSKNWGKSRPNGRQFSKKMNTHRKSRGSQ